MTLTIQSINALKSTAADISTVFKAQYAFLRDRIYRPIANYSTLAGKITMILPSTVLLSLTLLFVLLFAPVVLNNHLFEKKQEEEPVFDENNQFYKFINQDIDDEIEEVFKNDPLFLKDLDKLFEAMVESSRTSQSMAQPVEFEFESETDRQRYMQGLDTIPLGSPRIKIFE